MNATVHTYIIHTCMHAQVTYEYTLMHLENVPDEKKRGASGPRVHAFDGCCSRLYLARSRTACPRQDSIRNIAACRPLLFRYPFLDGRLAGRGEGSVRPDDVQMRLCGRSVRRRQGGHQDQPETLLGTRAGEDLF